MEYFDFGKMTALGVVFDISKRKEGKESLHFALRRELIRVIQREQEYIRVFLHGSPVIKIPETPGHCISSISENRPTDTNIGAALRQTTALVCNYLEDCDKHVMVVTDRFDGRGGDRYDAAGQCVEALMIDCSVHVIALGPFCSATLSRFLRPSTTFSHLADSSAFGKYLERFSCQIRR